MFWEDLTSPMIVAPGLRERISRAIDDHQLIAIENSALFVDRAESVRIAIERQADVGFPIEDGRDQMLQILRLRRIRMMVGEMPVHFEEKFRRFAV